jgi:hypothetical protein
MKRIIGILLISSFFCLSSYAQIETLYVPVTINSPLFSQESGKEWQIGAKINNYGLHFNFAAQSNNKILIFSIQQNNGNIRFDPLNFNEYYAFGQEKHLIQSYPAKMFYCEIGVGQNFYINTQKLSLLTGLGRQFQNNNTRFFVQFDWGNEFGLINAGVSLRGNYTTVQNNSLFTLEPIVQGKFKIWKLRIVNQFGYSIAVKKDHDYMKPIFTAGLEYIL